MFNKLAQLYRALLYWDCANISQKSCCFVTFFTIHIVFFPSLFISNLTVVLITFLFCVFFFFVIYFVFSHSAPKPTTSLAFLAAKCIDVRRPHHSPKWLLPWGNDRCNSIRTFDDAASRLIEANDIVFSVHIPFQGQEMSPWFQFMLIILQLDIAFKLNNYIGTEPLKSF